MKHLAIIADGNRRWAKERDQDAVYGHTAGLAAIENACEWAVGRSVPFITVYCFSTENWGRAQTEIDNIFRLARLYFTYRVGWYIQRGIRVRFAGRRDRLPDDLIDMINQVEESTSDGDNLTLTICVDYGGRDEIVRAVMDGARTEEEISKAVMGNRPEPDMILRTGGQKRLSGFMLWDCAYSELYFLEKYFPDLNSDDLDNALVWFNDRVRNFGK